MLVSGVDLLHDIRTQGSARVRLVKRPREDGDHLAATGSPWPENPNCIYMGGFGIGPMNPVSPGTRTRPLGPRGRLRDRKGDDLVLAVLDGEGYFWDYDKKCADCGIKQLTAQLAADRARPRGRGHRHRRHARALRAGLHRRLGLRARLVHEAGHRLDQVDRPRRRRDDAPGGARERRDEARAVQPRAPRHLPLGRGAAARVAARVRPATAQATRRRRSPRSAPTPRTRRRSARTAARRIPTGPACSSRASRSASAASACTS